MRNLSLQATTKIIARLLDKSAAELTQGFQPATREQLPEILAIRQSIGVNASITEDEQYLLWRYSFSPSAVPDEPLRRNCLWVLVLDGQVLSFLGTEATKLNIDNSTINSLKVMDIAVLKEHDGKGLGVWMTLKLQNEGLPITVAGSNEHSAGIVSKLFNPLPPRKIYKNVLCETGYFTKIVKVHYASLCLSFTYRIYLYFALSIKTSLARSKLKLQALEQFEATSKAISSLTPVSFVRDADYLNWRLSNPRENNVVNAIWFGDELIGYVAYSIRQSTQQKSALVWDWGFFEKDHYTRYFPVILLMLQRKLLADNFSNIVVLCYDKSSEGSLRKAGLFLRDNTTKTFSVFCNDPSLSRTLQNPENWFLSGGDGDDF